MFYKSRMLCLAVLLAGCTIARADEWNKETAITFTESVEIPGQVLQPGNYVFKLADNRADRHIVQIFNADQSQLIATIPAIPAYRLEPTGETQITFQERSNGAAISRWFCPGDLEGVAFVYPTE